MLDTLFEKYARIVVLDTETTGIDCRTDEIIELAAVSLTPDGVEREMDDLIQLSAGRHLPPVIVNLTGITEAMLDGHGVEKRAAAERFVSFLQQEKTLVVAYNAQFDLCFLYYFLAAHGLSGALKGVEMLDAMTVYKDRRPYPHKLKNAIEAYGVLTQNTHRAVDDAKATYELLLEMEKEENDLHRYINLFGYNAKYGISGPRISSIRYAPQGSRGEGKLYAQPCMV